MAYHGLGPAATQLLDSSPSSSRGGHQGCLCSVLATSSAQHALLQSQVSLPLPSLSSCPASALHRPSLLVPMSSPSNMVLLQHVHPSSRTNCHPSFECGCHRHTFYSHHLDSSCLSPIIDVLSTQIGAACRPSPTTSSTIILSTQIGAACLSPTASSTIISTATTFCHRFRFIYLRLWGVLSTTRPRTKPHPNRFLTNNPQPSTTTLLSACSTQVSTVIDYHCGIKVETFFNLLCYRSYAQQQTTTTCTAGSPASPVFSTLPIIT